jgi:hypothetical protein
MLPRNQAHHSNKKQKYPQGQSVLIKEKIQKLLSERKIHLIVSVPDPDPCPDRQAQDAVPTGSGIRNTA